MVKEHFVEEHGVPLTTPSAWAAPAAGIQQYVYGQDSPGPDRRGDPAVYSYPDR